jgi:branched-chain amino acid transport system substrate-binding protein
MRFLVRACVFTLVVLSAGCNRKTAPEPIFLGHVAPLSGRAKVVGEHARRGIQLALEEANARGDMPGGRPLEVLHVDSKGDPDLAERQAVRLLKVSAAAAILGGADGPEVERLARAAQPLGAAVVTPASWLDRPGADPIFSLGLTPEGRGKALALFAAKELKLEQVGVVSRRDDRLAAALVEAFRQAFAAGAGQRVESEREYASAADLVAVADRLKERKPNAILFAGPPEDLLKLRERIAGTPPVILYGGDEADQSLLLADRQLAEGVYLATAFVADLDTAPAKEFAKKHQDRFGEPPDVHAALGYEAVRFALDGLRPAKVVTAPRLREELFKVGRFEGLSGPMTVGGDRRVNRPAYVVRAEQGRLVMQKAYPADAK